MNRWRKGSSVEYCDISVISCRIDIATIPMEQSDTQSCCRQGFALIAADNRQLASLYGAGWFIQGTTHRMCELTLIVH